MTQRYTHSNLPIIHGDQTCSLLFATCFENIERKGEMLIISNIIL